MWVLHLGRARKDKVRKECHEVVPKSSGAGVESVGDAHVNRYVMSGTKKWGRAGLRKSRGYNLPSLPDTSLVTGKQTIFGFRHARAFRVKRIERLVRLLDRRPRCKKQEGFW